MSFLKLFRERNHQAEVDGSLKLEVILDSLVSPGQPELHRQTLLGVGGQEREVIGVTVYHLRNL